MGLKREASHAGTSPRAQRRKESTEDYCDQSPAIDAAGSIVWPAESKAMEDARGFIREWWVALCSICGIEAYEGELMFSASAQAKVLIVPDKDADGLNAGVILHKTLISLGLSSNLIDVHLIGKNSTVHDEVERVAMQAKHPKYIIVVDQGSRAAPSFIESEDSKCLIIDHHLSDEFPKDAMVSLHYLASALCEHCCADRKGRICVSFPPCGDLRLVDL